MTRLVHPGEPPELRSLPIHIVQHFLLGWTLANTSRTLSWRDRGLITVAAVIPDIDGLGLLVEIPTRNTAYPLLWWTDYHHILAHNLGFALLMTTLALLTATTRLRTTLLTVRSFHTHILGDIVGARGPDGYQWPIPYFLPFSPTPELSWEGQWALNGWQNMVTTAVLLFSSLFLAWKRGYSPVGLFSTRADQHVVDTLRHRFGVPGSIRAVPSPGDP